MHCNYHIWYKMGNMHIVSCDKKSLKLAINYLLDQCLFKIGNLLLVQAIGIPAEFHYVNFMANIFLLTYESK